MVCQILEVAKCLATVPPYCFLGTCLATLVSRTLRLYQFYTYLIFSLQLEWREALQYCTELIFKNKWSKSLYSYQKAAIMCMFKENLTKSELQEVDNLMK